MTLAAIVAIALGLVLGALQSEYNRRLRKRQPAWLASVTLSNVSVHTTDDMSLEGLLVLVAPDGVVLRAASYIGENDQRVNLPGETFVPRGRISLVQRIGAA